MFLAENKDYVEDSINLISDQTDSQTGLINSALFSLLENPTDEQIKKFRDIRDSLIVAWLTDLLDTAKQDYFKSAQIGIDIADRQLKAKNKTKIINKAIDKKTYTDKVNNSINSLSQDLTAIAESIKANSERIIKELKSSPTANTLKEQKKISSELVTQLKEKGITFFTDKIGRKTPIEKYIKMRVFTDTVSLQRTTFFVRAIQYGVDLVRIKHLNIHPQCPLCIPFQNKILSINGDSEGYMTIEQAESYGLFHPNCDHIPEELELEPIDNGGEGVIKLSKENQKRYEYNQKRNVI